MTAAICPCSRPFAYAADAPKPERCPLCELRAAMTTEVEKAQADLKAERDSHELTSGCLGMIHDSLVSHGMDMSGCPPMFYPEAIHNAILKPLYAVAEALGLKVETFDGALGGKARRVVGLSEIGDVAVKAAEVRAERDAMRVLLCRVSDDPGDMDDKVLVAIRKALGSDGRS